MQDERAIQGHAASIKVHSDSFTGKKLGTAVRQFLEMRKASGMDAPATTREIFDALKEGGFVSGAKDEATGMVVLRTMLRKNSAFYRLKHGKYGLRGWYPHLAAAKEAGANEAGSVEPEKPKDNVIVVDSKGTAAAQKKAAAGS